MLEKIKQFLVCMNQQGIPLPMLRDNRSGKGSVSLTMMVVSFTISVLLLAGKVTKFVGDVDYNNALWLFGLTASLYFGRKISGDGKKFELEKGDSNGDSAK